MSPQAWRVAEFLQRRGLQGADNVEIATACFCLRYGARISELRKAGYGVDVKRLSKSRYQYAILSTPPAASAAQRA
jgi:hypothetical protein